MKVAAVVIGRNEGARLIACLDALAGKADPVIYVDSGSTDGSVAAARARGAQVVALDMTRPVTAARARNAGLAVLPEEVALRRTFWLVRHADDRRVRRMSRFAELLCEGLRAEVERLEADA